MNYLNIKNIFYLKLFQIYLNIILFYYNFNFFFTLFFYSNLFHIGNQINIDCQINNSGMKNMYTDEILAEIIK
jgi:hypothetical protein